MLPFGAHNRQFTVKGALRGAAFASLGLVLGAGSLALMPAGTAQAMPISAIQAPTAETGAILVRDGCGRGMRFSNSRQRCVPGGDGGFRGDDFRRSPPPRAFEGDFRRGPPPRAFDSDVRRGPPRMDGGCPRGQRFSNSRQGCVWN